MCGIGKRSQEELWGHFGCRATRLRWGGLGCGRCALRGGLQGAGCGQSVGGRCLRALRRTRLRRWNSEDRLRQGSCCRSPGMRLGGRCRAEERRVSPTRWCRTWNHWAVRSLRVSGWNRWRNCRVSELRCWMWERDNWQASQATDCRNDTGANWMLFATVPGYSRWTGRLRGRYRGRRWSARSRGRCMWAGRWRRLRRQKRRSGAGSILNGLSCLLHSLACSMIRARLNSGMSRGRTAMCRMGRSSI